MLARTAAMAQRTVTSTLDLQKSVRDAAERARIIRNCALSADGTQCMWYLNSKYLITSS